jgi:hypothetical protein
MLSTLPEFSNPALPAGKEVVQMAEYCFAIKKLRSTFRAHVITDRELTVNEKLYQQTIERSLAGSLVAHDAPE